MYLIFNRRNILAQKDYPTQKNWGSDKRKKTYSFEQDGSKKEKERRKKDSERRRSKYKRDNYYNDED